MEIVSFVYIDENDSDLVIAFALDAGDGDIRSFILQRTPKFEFIMPEEERGTLVSLDGVESDHLNRLKRVEVDGTVLRIQTCLHAYTVDMRRLEEDDQRKVQEALKRQNFDHRFEIDVVNAK